jgi:YggT family protein
MTGLLLPLATTRTAIADYISYVIYVYIVIIFLYIVVQLLLNAGVRPPYSRVYDAILGFLREVCEPYLRLFRRIIPSFGPLDFSPIIGILLLEIVNAVVVNNWIHG